MKTHGVLRALDLPPVWLAGFLAFGWGIAQMLPVHWPMGQAVGAALVVAGLGLMVVAVAQMVLQRTTFIPRRDPAALVTGGVFALSRNPIYLADALILGGALLWWQGLAAIWLVPLFMAVIQRRFIRGEEAAIAARFGPAWTRYRNNTRRWM